MKSYKEAPREELIEMVETLDKFYEAYRKKILSTGIMNEEQLTRFDFSICDQYAREKYPFLFNFIVEEEGKA